MAIGVAELKRELRAAGGLTDFPEIHQFLDGFYLSRIGIRILIGQHIALHEPQKENHIGAHRPCLLVAGAAFVGTLLSRAAGGVIALRAQRSSVHDGHCGGLRKPSQARGSSNFVPRPASLALVRRVQGCIQSPSMSCTARQRASAGGCRKCLCPACSTSDRRALACALRGRARATSVEC